MNSGNQTGKLGLSDNCHCEERSDEAISSFPHKIGIATLPTVARNDKKGVIGQPLTGFTLVELLISSLLIALIAAAVYTAFSSGISIWKRTNSNIIQKERVLILLDRMAREIASNINYQDIKFEGTSSSLTFPSLIPEIITSSEELVIHRIGSIKYYFDSSKQAIKRVKQIYGKTDDGTPSERKMVSPVESLVFVYYDYDQDKDEWTWQDTWESDKQPAAVRIQITLKGAKNVREETITRTIALP